jgi:hypothetical protein
MSATALEKIMRKKLCVLFVLCLGPVAAVWADDTLPPKTHPDSSGWQNLFAPDLSDAIYPKGIWFVENGNLTASEDKIIWTKKQYEKAIIDLEFKNGPGANSGVFVYGSDISDNGWVSHSIEVQILDDYDARWAKVPKTWQCGGVFGHLAPAKQTVKKTGQWNRMTVTCMGPMIYVLLNGEQITEFDKRKWTSVKKNPDGSEIPAWYPIPAADLPAKGHIGLQGKHGGAPIYFRNLKVKAL